MGNDSRFSKRRFLLVEPVAKTPYPPLGLMKISSMLKDRHKGCEVISQVGNGNSRGDTGPDKIFITGLFTWDWKYLVESINYYKWLHPNSEIVVGGISASLLAEDVYSHTGIRPHVGLYEEAEMYPPDYSLTFGRKNGASITSTTRGCVRNCRFCSVRQLEPNFTARDDWEKDIVDEYASIVFWDNNFLASPNFERDCEKIVALGKKVDFNQGLDARRFDEEKAKLLFKMNLDPVRFAFDDVLYEEDILKAIRLAKKYTQKETMGYVLYNYEDTPEDLFYRIDLLNREGVLSFPMEYRAPNKDTVRFPGRHWNTFLLRAFKLSLLFYYRRGMITRSRESFRRIYGNGANQFVSRLYEIYEYDRTRASRKR